MRAGWYEKAGPAEQLIQVGKMRVPEPGAGIVTKVGGGLDAFNPGSRVWTFNAQWGCPCGTAAEYIALPVRLVRPLPDKTSFVEGACLGIPAMTACRVIFMDGPVTGQTVYVPAATGRVGAYAVQFAKWGGAKVIASVGRTERVEIAQGLGADLVIDRSRENVETTILEATDSQGVDRIAEVTCHSMHKYLLRTV